MLNKNEIEKYLKFYNSEFGKEVLKGELEFVESKLKNCKNVLSIGCGPTLLEAKLHRLHPEMNIMGLDISKQMIKQAPKSIPVACGDAQHLEFNNNSFDAVLYVTSLEFIKSYKKALMETYRVLGSKGKILILMLNPKSSYFKEEYKDRNSYIRKNIKHTNVEEIKEFISKYFFIENEEYFLGIKKGEIVASKNPGVASLYILEGKKDAR